MNTQRSLSLSAVLCLGTMLPVGAAESGQILDSPPVAPEPVPGITVPPATNTTTSVSAVQWADIKGFGFDQREQVFAGLKGLEARVDAQISELAVKREALVASNTSTQAWDFTMQEMTTARTALKSAISDLQDASRETWDQMKDRVGDAWTRTQDAYSKVKASTTQ